MSDNPVAPQENGTVTGQTPAQEKTERTFTQAELNAFLAEERRKTEGKYADHKTLQEKAAKLDQLEEAQKTEQQKLAEKLQQLEQQAQTAQTSARNALIRAAVVAEAAKAGFVDPSDAVALVDNSKITIDGDNVAGAADAVKALADTKPHLIKKAGQTASIGATNPAGSGSGGRDMSWVPLFQFGNNDPFGSKPKK